MDISLWFEKSKFVDVSKLFFLKNEGAKKIICFKKVNGLVFDAPEKVFP